MVYTLDLHINTDGDFGFSYGPIGMTYDDDYLTYDFTRTYRDKEKAINDIIGIIDILKNSIHTSREWIKYAWLEHCDIFIDRILNEKNNYIYEVMGGNQEGTFFLFKESCHTINFNLSFSDEEYAMIQNSENNVDYMMIKEAILKLYEEEK